MKQGAIHEVKTSYEGQKFEENCVSIKVYASLKVPQVNTDNPIVSITGKETTCEPFACVYIGHVVSSNSVFVTGARVVAFGYSEALSTEEIIGADKNVVTSIDCNLDDVTVLLSGYASPWINMLKIANPPLGSVIRVGGKYAAMVSEFLKNVGYSIADDESEADYYFPTDEQSKGQGTNQILWNGKCGADWNDPRLFDTRYTFPRAYVNHTVLENLKTFWTCMNGKEWDSSVWPVDLIERKKPNNVFGQTKVSYIPEDEEYLSILGDAKVDLACRKKPVTICMMVGTKSDNSIYTSSLRKIIAWVGSIPTKTTWKKEEKCMQLAFEDGSVGTIQFIDHQAVDHAQLHFDGKSIVMDGKNVISYDCAGVGSIVFMQDNLQQIKDEREKAVKLYEQLSR